MIKREFLMLNSPNTAKGRPKSLEKRTKILTSASQLFLHNGFVNTSMDNVAKHSGVSKQTVYSHFANKDDLFTAVIIDKCHEYRLDDLAHNHNQALSVPEFEEALQRLAVQFVALMHDPIVCYMYQTLISESKAQPHVTQIFYQTGPLRTLIQVQQFIMGMFPSMTESDAFDYATDFFNLLKGEYHMKSIMGLYEPMSDSDQVIFAKQRCQKFLKILPARV